MMLAACRQRTIPGWYIPVLRKRLKYDLLLLHTYGTYEYQIPCGIILWKSLVYLVFCP
jgi:hypothetical protein